MKIIPDAVNQRFLWVDRAGETRINYEVAWEDMHAGFLQVAANEGLDVAMYETLNRFKDPATRTRYEAYKEEWRAQNHLG